MSRRGFTMIELLVALVLFGLVGTSIYRLLVTNQRLYVSQSERVNTNQAARAAASILPGSIRELSASDPDGSDILVATSTGFRYRSLKNVYFACQNGTAGQIIVDGARWFGIRAIDVTTDSLLIFAEGDPTTRTDDRWLHANVIAATAGTSCSAPSTTSLTLTVTLLSGAMTSVLKGAPIRSYQIEQVSAYADAGSNWWLGSQTINKTTGTASTIQPIVGPLQSDSGLALAYYDSTGTVTANRALISRIGITVRSRSMSQAQTGTGSVGYITQNLGTIVSLRNNRRY